MTQNKIELLNLVVDSFEDLKILEQSVKKAFADLDKDISDVCFKFITIVGLSTFLLSGKLDQQTINGNNKILAILYFDNRTEICDSDPVVDPRRGKPHTRLLEFQNQYKDVLQTVPSNNRHDMNNDHHHEQQNIKLMKQDK